MRQSPFTGMTRRHCLEVAKFLTEGVFQHVDSIEDPIVLPKQDTISYPQPNDPKHRFQAAEFEGLVRTLMAASPVLGNSPNTVCNGINIRDFYASQILQGTAPKSRRSWGRISEFTRETGRMHYPQKVEGAALMISRIASSANP